LGEREERGRDESKRSRKVNLWLCPGDKRPITRHPAGGEKERKRERE